MKKDKPAYMPRASQGNKAAQAQAPKPKPKKTQTKPNRRPQNKDAAQDKRIARLEAKVSGPEVKETWTTTVNLGTIHGVAVDGFTRVSHTFLHPALLRDVDASAATNPTAVRAAQYAMYRVHSAELKLHSLVGSSGVAGAICVCALQLDSSSGLPTSFDSVAARQHRTVSIGQQGRFKPKLPVGDASWMFTDTKAHTGAEALGSSLEVFLLGRTTNIYTNQDYTSPLWRITLSVTYQFANYRPDLQLAELAAAREEHTLKVSTDEKGDVVVETGVPMLGARFHTAAPGIADVVLSLVDVAGGLASQIPIIGPLLDTGLAFLKPILSGKGKAGETHKYLLCGSFDEAKAADAITVPDKLDHTYTGDFRIQQLTPANLGATSSVGPSPEPAPRVPVLPSSQIHMDNLPTQHFGFTIPAWTTTVSRVTEANPGQFTLHLQYPVCGSNDDVIAPNKPRVHKTWQLAGFSSEHVWQWTLCSGGTTNGANAIISHVAGTTTLGSAGLLGTAAALAADPGVLPTLNDPNPTAARVGWAVVDRTDPATDRIQHGDLVMPVHFNNWFSSNANQRKASIGWMFCRPSTQTIFVIGAYNVPSGVSSPGDGVAHFYTVTSTAGFTTTSARNINPIAEWLCLEEL